MVGEDDVPLSVMPVDMCAAAGLVQPGANSAVQATALTLGLRPSATSS